MVHLTLDRKTVERWKIARVIKDGPMRHHPYPIPRRLQIQPRGNLDFLEFLVDRRGQDMDSVEQRARKVLTDWADRVLELIHVPKPIRSLVICRCWCMCGRFFGVPELAPPTLVSSPKRLIKGRLVLVLLLDCKQPWVRAINPGVHHIHGQVLALRIIEGRVQVKLLEPIDSPVWSLCERVLIRPHPRAGLASVDW